MAATPGGHLRASSNWGQAGTWLLTRSHVGIESVRPALVVKVLQSFGEWKTFCGAMRLCSGRTLTAVEHGVHWSAILKKIPFAL